MKWKRGDDMNYEVIVSNIGTVYEGTNGFKAIREYNAYVGISKRSIGRAAGERVTMLRDGEIHKEHIGTQGY